MTLGIGMVPTKEKGCVLMTDSLVPCLEPDGKTSYGDEIKLCWLAGTETAVIISGYISDRDLAANGILPDYLGAMMPYEPDPRARVSRAFAAIQRIDAAVRARHPGYDLYHQLGDPGPHALFAVGRQGEPPLLARFTTKTVTWAEPGDVYAIGAWCLGLPQVPDIALEMQLPAPDSLEDCRSLAVNWVRRFCDRVFGYRDAYEMICQRGLAPAIGGPLQVLTMRSDSSHVCEEIPIVEEIPST